MTDFRRPTPENIELGDFVVYTGFNHRGELFSISKISRSKLYFEGIVDKRNVTYYGDLNDLIILKRSGEYLVGWNVPIHPPHER